MPKFSFCIAAVFGMVMSSAPALAGVTIAPYASINSTKEIKPAAKGAERSSLKERQEYGLRGAVKMFSLFSLQLSAGQSQLTTTQKVQDAGDEYKEIDYQKDLNMATTDPASQIKVTEVQKNGKLNVTFDPGFSIFILRATAGVTAMLRTVATEQAGQPNQQKTFGPTYKANSGVGFGVRLSPTMFFLAEYNMYHYAFPKLQPFERQAAVTYGVTL